MVSSSTKNKCNLIGKIKEKAPTLNYIEKVQDPGRYPQECEHYLSVPATQTHARFFLLFIYLSTFILRPSESYVRNAIRRMQLNYRLIKENPSSDRRQRVKKIRSEALKSISLSRQYVFQLNVMVLIKQDAIRFCYKMKRSEHQL